MNQTQLAAVQPVCVTSAVKIAKVWLYCNGSIVKECGWKDIVCTYESGFEPKAKQRHGPIGTVETHFEGGFTRFSDLARD